MLNATLISRRDLDDRHTVFTVLPDEPVQFVAGQWTEMGLSKADDGEIGPSGDEFVKDGVVRRAYSIASPPGQRELEFFFNKVEEGQLTRWLWDLGEGDRLYVDPEARGHFTVDAAQGPETLLFVATGTGLAPFVSILRHYLGHAPDIHVGDADNEPRVPPGVPERNKTIPWHHAYLVHGVRHRSLLAYEKDLSNLAGEHEDLFTYLPTLSREPKDSDWQGKRGRVTELVRELVTNSTKSEITLDPARCHAYLCGNATMIAAVETELMQVGMIPRWQDPEGNIHTEVYY